MAEKRDKSQYGNQKKLSTQHYLVKMLNKILSSVDQNSKNEAFCAILHLVDWSQAFDRQSHTLGVQSFIDNGVRPALIPILVNFFQNRKMRVKWKGYLSTQRTLNGGGPQGGTLGIEEYLSQSNDNTIFLKEDEKFNYIDDLSMLDLVNLISIGIANYNFKSHVASDIGIDNKYLPPENIMSRSVHLVRPITKCIWFVLVPNDEISFGLVWFSLAGQLPNAICFGLVTNGKIIFGLLWFSLTGQLPNVICFGLVTNEIISFGPICFGLAIQLPNGFCFGLVLNQIRPNDFGFVLCLNKWLLTFSHTHAHILTYTNSHSHT